MPKLVTLAVNSAFQGKNAEQKEAFEAAKKKGPIKGISYVTAMENIKRSGGMYQLMTAEPKAVPSIGLADMDLKQLKIMLASFGIKPEKQMRKSDVIRLLERKLDEVEIEEDEDQAASEGAAE